MADKLKMERKITDVYLKLSKCIMKYRYLLVILVCLLQTALANYLAFVIRFDAFLSRDNINTYILYLPFLLLIRSAFFFRDGLYKGMWRYASTSDLIKIIKSTTFSSITFLLFVYYLLGDESYPRSVYILDWML